MTGHMALVVDETGAALELGAHRTLVLHHADGRNERVGLNALNAIVLHGDVALGTKLLRAVAEHNIALSCLAGDLDFAPPAFVRQPQGQVALRHHQHLAYADGATRLELARAVVFAKVRAMAEKGHDCAPGGGDAFLPAMVRVSQAHDIAALMGVEGAATAEHFRLIGTLYDASGKFVFGGRSRRPPKNAPNALMSLSYTMAQSAALQLALHSGLDPQLGFLHAIHRQRPSLALDLIEAARPGLDHWVIDMLLRRGLIAASRFSTSENGAVTLTKEGRKLFYPLWFGEGVRVALPAMRRLMAEILRRLRLHSITPVMKPAGFAIPAG